MSRPTPTNVIISSRDSKCASEFAYVSDELIGGIYEVVYARIPAHLPTCRIAAGNGTVYFRENDSDLQAVIPPKSYTIETLANAVAAVMTGASRSGAVYSATGADGKLTITGTQPFGFRWGSFAVNSASKSLGFADLDSDAHTTVTGVNSIAPIPHLHLLITVGSSSGGDIIVTKDSDGTYRLPPKLRQFCSFMMFSRTDIRVKGPKAGAGAEVVDLSGDWEMILHKVAKKKSARDRR